MIAGAVMPDTFFKRLSVGLMETGLPGARVMRSHAIVACLFACSWIALDSVRALWTNMLPFMLFLSVFSVSFGFLFRLHHL